MHVKDENLLIAEQRALELRDLLDHGSPRDVVAKARELLQIDPEDINLCNTAAGFLIDGGARDEDLVAIDEGMGLFNHLIESNLPEEDILTFHYNLSNGYAARYTYYRNKNDADRAEEEIQKQKGVLQGILLRRKHLPPEFLPRVLTNYANLLDHLNRTFEAVDYYLECLEIEPRHGLAAGNCGEALRRVIAWSDQHRLRNLDACWTLFTRAVEKPEQVTVWAGPDALANIQRKRDLLSAEIERGLQGGSEALAEFSEHRRDAHAAPPPAWLRDVIRDRLLLSFNAVPFQADDDGYDDAFFDTLIQGRTEEERTQSIALIDIVNSLKEDFVTARYLYYQFVHDDGPLQERNKRTYYGDPVGSSEFGLLSGLLKTSFRLAVDLLDKIALFLSRYFELGDSTRSPNINNVWFESYNTKAAVVHPKIVAALGYNFALRGLRDLQRDFFRQEFPGRAKDTRNALVHRWVTLHWLPVDRKAAGEESWNLEDFAVLTRFMLRQAKAAILTLIAAINVEEHRRKAHNKGKIFLPQELVVRKPLSARAHDDLDGEEDGLDDTE